MDVADFVYVPSCQVFIRICLTSSEVFDRVWLTSSEM